MRIAVAVLTGVWLLSAAACRASVSSDAPADGGAVAESEVEGDDLVGEAVAVSSELPAELVAELRLRGDDVDGRLLTLAPGFIATAACSDCGAPSYLWFVAVRCSDTRHCEVLTETCEGSISRDANTYELEFQPVEGSAGAESCAGYSGTFEASQTGVP